MKLTLSKHSFNLQITHTNQLYITHVIQEQIKIIIFKPCALTL